MEENIEKWKNGKSKKVNCNCWKRIERNSNIDEIFSFILYNSTPIERRHHHAKAVHTIPFSLHARTILRQIQYYTEIIESSFYNEYCTTPTSNLLMTVYKQTKK